MEALFPTSLVCSVANLTRCSDGLLAIDSRIALLIGSGRHECTTQPSSEVHFADGGRTEPWFHLAVRAGFDLVAVNRANLSLSVGRLLIKWKQLGGGGSVWRDLHFDQFGRDLEIYQRTGYL